MASKKESDQELQAQLEEKVAKLHRRFSSMKLVPEDVAVLEELPISPALGFDETDDEPLPPLEKSKPAPQEKPVEPDKPAPEQRPQSKPSQSKSEDLGAAGFLLSGMVPKSQESSSGKPDNEEDDRKKKVTTDAQATKTPASTTPEKPKPVAPDAEPKVFVSSLPVEPKSETQAPLADKPQEAKSEEPKVIEDPKTSSEEEEGSAQEENDSGKSGMFAKAKSLLATITKKDKK